MSIRNIVDLPFLAIFLQSCKWRLVHIGTVSKCKYMHGTAFINHTYVPHVLYVLVVVVKMGFPCLSPVDSICWYILYIIYLYNSGLIQLTLFVRHMPIYC